MNNEDFNKYYVILIFGQTLVMAGMAVAIIMRLMR